MFIGISERASDELSGKFYFKHELIPFCKRFMCCFSSENEKVLTSMLSVRREKDGRETLDYLQNSTERPHEKVLLKFVLFE